jgi:energy-coupling factor transporter ATP-binding protein EcfA2
VDDKDLYSGRHGLIMDCIGALFQKGRHIAVYGERGVGKTSLAKVLPAIVHQPEIQLIGVRIDCSTDDDFGTIWKRVFREMEEPPPEPEDLSPDGIRFRLQKMGGVRLIALDEFDRISNDDTLTMLADTVKALSDSAIDVTMMLVGVAESIDHLVGEHESVTRAITQIFMPRMTPDELDGILTPRLPLAGLEMESNARRLIVRMSEGLPTFVHLLALHAGQRCVADDRSLVTVSDVHSAIRSATRSHTMMSDYTRAIRSNQSANLFRQVLLACTYTASDHEGFRATDVIPPLSVILDKPVQLQTFSWHLKELGTEERGRVLQKSGKPRRSRYRFKDPLLQPFIKMVSLGEATVSQRTLEELERRFPAFRPETASDWPSEWRQLVGQSPDAPRG